MNRILYKLLYTIVGVVLILVPGVHACNSFAEPYQSETAYEYIQPDFITARGIAVRDETVLRTAESGVFSYLFEDGGKVSRNMNVAEIYKSEADAANETAIQRLEKEIASLELAQDPARADYVNAQVLSSQINQTLSHIVSVSDSRSMGELQALKDRYVMLINTRQIATARAEDFEPRIASLKAQVQSLKSANPQKVASVTAAAPGYFVSVADGWESALTIAGLKDLTPDTLGRMLVSGSPSPPLTGTVGKIVNSFEWYYAVLVPNKTAQRFSKEQSVTVRFPYLSDDTHTAVVDRIYSGEENTTVVLRFNEINARLCTLRSEEVEIVFSYYRGLKVRDDALRFQETQPGVYTINSAGISFKKVDILFYGDGFVLSRIPADTDAAARDYLRLYDQMVISGRELYQQALTKSNASAKGASSQKESSSSSL